MKHKAVAYHLGIRINLKELKGFIKYKLVKNEHTFLLYKVKDKSYCYLKDYGSIVFINLDDKFIKQTIGSILKNSVELDDLYSEKFVLAENKIEEFHVEFDKIIINELTLDVAHMIMLNLGQTVALDYYYNRSLSLLEKIKEYSSQLENKGHIQLSRKKLKQFIGKTMNLKNSIAENLFIFETSDLAWADESLGLLDRKMRDELEIINRHHGLQHNINVITDNLDFFKDILQHKHSSLLEWIIIILILIEVIQVLFEKLL